MKNDNFAKTFSNRLKKALADNNMMQSDLVYELRKKGFKVTDTAVSFWVNGTKTPRMDKVDALCEIFNVDRMYFLSNDTDNSILKFPNIQKVSTESIPILGSVRCGKPIFINEEHTEFIEKPDCIKCDFCLRATGDSMIDKDIKDGDYVFIQQTTEIINGKIYVVAIDDEATLKIVDYDKLNNTISLIPANKNFQVMIFKDEQLDHIHILGRAIYFKRYL